MILLTSGAMRMMIANIPISAALLMVLSCQLMKGIVHHYAPLVNSYAFLLRAR